MTTLKEIRQSNQLTQVQTAKRLGVTERAYQMWENGDAAIPNGRLIPLARLLKISVDDLLKAWAEMFAVDAIEIKSC